MRMVNPIKSRKYVAGALLLFIMLLAAAPALAQASNTAVQVSFDSSAYALDEGAKATVTVSLDQDPGRTVTIPLTTTHLTGATEADYSWVPDDITFKSGETEKTFEFRANPDRVEDDGEAVRLGFGSTLPADVSTGSISETTVSIADVSYAQGLVNGSPYPLGWPFGMPQGIWSDGTTMWVVNSRPRVHRGIYAYNIADWTRDPSKDFSFFQLQRWLGFGVVPDGIWSNGSILWVDTRRSNSASQRQILAYSLRGKNRVPSMDMWNMPGSGDIWSDGFTMWMLENSTIYAVDMFSRQRVPDKEFGSLLYGPGRPSLDNPQNPLGIWSNGTTMWAAEFTGDPNRRKDIYAYNMSDKQRDPSKDIDGINWSGNDRATSIWSDGAVMWVADKADDALYVYHSPSPTVAEEPDDGPLTASFHEVPTSHRGRKPFRILLRFSDDPSVGFSTMRDRAFQVTGGRVTSARRLFNGRNDQWEIVFRPSGSANMTITLPATTNCSAQGAICMADGRMLSNSNMVIVSGTSNNRATGAPTISGTPRVGQTLSASTADIRDADGLSRVRYSYQWLRDGNSIIGATASTYTLVATDQGKAISVRVTFNDDLANAETLTSAGTSAVVPRSLPLTASFHDLPTTHDGSAAFTFETRFSEAPTISAESLRTQAFKVTGGSVTGAGRLVTGKNLRWEITVPPSVRGTVTVTLPITTGCTDKGAICTSDGRKLSTPVRLEVRGPNSRDVTTNNRATGAPTISGTAQVRETLTASTSGIADSDGLTEATFAYQWLRRDGNTDTDISGATASTYTLVDADDGKTIKVRVSFTDDNGNAEELTSAATATVAGGLALLTATVHDKPSSHDSSSVFTFELRFSENIPVSYRTLRDDAFTVVGGDVVKVRRLEQGSNVRWEISVEPTENWTVTLTLPATTDCTATGAICTEDGRMLSDSVSVAVAGPGSSANTAATGAPTISGTARVGEMLTASTSGISDANGLTNATFAYQWLRNDGNTDTEISGATASTYNLVDADQGKTIKVKVSFTDDDGNAESRTSAATARVDAQPNNPATGTPSITGTARVGETLTATTSGISDSDGLDNATFSYQWVRNDGNTDTDISGATASTYNLAGTDQGKTIKVKVSFTDDRGNAESLTSEASETVEARPNTAATGAPSITGTARVDETLTASTSGISDADGLTNATFSYQWLRRDGNTDTDISGATGSSYTLAEADEGKTIKVRVSFADDWGNDESLTSAATAEVAAPLNRPATGAPSITGSARVGGTLTASTSGISDSDGLDDATFSYQWIRRDGGTDTDISGATGSTYTLVDADQGKTIKVRVSFTDDRGHDESRTSAATGTIQASADTPIWSAVMTVRDFGRGDKGAASSSRFSDESGEFRISRLWHSSSRRELYLAFQEHITEYQNLTLHVGDLELAFQERAGDFSFTFTGVDVTWTDGQTVNVSITRQ